MEKKNILRFIGIIAFVAVIGFSFAACGGDDDGDGGGGLPPGVGNNAVGGKTYYRSSNKTEFAANGSYTGYSPKSGSGSSGYDLDANGRKRQIPMGHQFNRNIHME